MEEADMKAILREAFGDSSSDRDRDSDSDGETFNDRGRGLHVTDSRGEITRPVTIFGDARIWEPVGEISGLWICRDFLSSVQQSSLLAAIEDEGYLADASHNQVEWSNEISSGKLKVVCFYAKNLDKRHQLAPRATAPFSPFWSLLAMRFGNLPSWANELSCIIRENVLLDGFSSESVDLAVVDSSKESSIFPSEILWREPLFDQFIVNIYQPGEGICAHVDLMRFEDGIAIISLESSCVMHFSSVESEANHLDSMNEGSALPAKIPVLLTPGSLVLMWDEARYLWKHEINRKPGFQIWQGQEIDQKRRVSVTLRKLCRTE